jgi:hypothetical protein
MPITYPSFFSLLCLLNPHCLLFKLIHSHELELILLLLSQLLPIFELSWLQSYLLDSSIACGLGLATNATSLIDISPDDTLGATLRSDGM